MRKVIEEESRVGSVLGGNSIKELFKGSEEDFSDFIEDLICGLAGETRIGFDRDIPHGVGMNFTIYGDETNIHVYYNYKVEYIDNEEYREYIFGKYD